MKVTSVTYSPHPVLSPLNKREWFLAEELKIWIVADGTECQWIIPKGFITDLRSGPDMVRVVLPKWGEDSAQAALIILHDYCYCEGARTSSGLPIERKEADDILAEGLRFTGHPSWKCAMARAGLAIAGGGHYCKDLVRVFDTQKMEAREL